MKIRDWVKRILYSIPTAIITLASLNELLARTPQLPSGVTLYNLALVALVGVFAFPLWIAYQLGIWRNKKRSGTVLKGSPPPEAPKYALPEHPTRIRVEKKVFENQDVYIDGHSWIDCKFIKCNIIAERGDFDLVSNSFDGCRLSVKGPAEGIIRLAKGFFPELPVIEPTIRAKPDLPPKTEPNLTYLKLGFQAAVRQNLREIESKLSFEHPKPIHFKSWNETESDMKKQLIDNENVYEIVEKIAAVLNEWNNDLDRASLLMLEPDSKIFLYIQSCKKYYAKLTEIGFLS